MSKSDLSKETMYEGVKLLVDCPFSHILLKQQKLYTLFTLGLQYLLFMSTKKPGHYIIRVEDSYLLEKLQRNCKDMNARKFMQRIALPRRYKHANACFHLDFFHVSSWSKTCEIPKEQIQGALIIRNPNKNPLLFNEVDEETDALLAALPKNYSITSLIDFVPKTITIAFDEDIEGLEELNFPFIKDEPRERTIPGVNIAKGIEGID